MLLLTLVVAPFQLTCQRDEALPRRETDPLDVLEELLAGFRIDVCANELSASCIACLILQSPFPLRKRL